jgi:hypothetical protein
MAVSYVLSEKRNPLMFYILFLNECMEQHLNRLQRPVAKKGYPFYMKGLTLLLKMVNLFARKG